MKALKGDQRRVFLSNACAGLSFLLIAGLFLLTLPSFSWAGGVPLKITKSFERFQRQWFCKLGTHCGVGKRNIMTKKVGDVYVATFKKIAPDVTYKVRKTSHKNVPYVAVLKYTVEEYVSRGSTPEEAQKGPFEKASSRDVTEIFPYARGKWRF